MSAAMVRVECGSASRVCRQEEAVDVGGDLIAETGLSYVDLRFVRVGFATTPSKPMSEFGGALVEDAEARVRIEAQQSALRAAGVRVARRAQEHAALAPISDACEAGWTRAIQDRPTAVRRTAEQAIGEWMVSGRKVGCLLHGADE